MSSHVDMSSSAITVVTADEDLNEYIIYIGNPGVGKSFLLNGLVQRAVFKSNYSNGTGLTQKLQLHEHNGDYYGDTPGLSDLEIRKQAAKEIQKILSKNGRYKLVFVVTLEAGRLKPDDIATQKLVLESISIGKPVQYGVLINKCSERAIQLMDVNKIIAGLTTGENSTTYILPLLRGPAYDDMEDVVPSLDFLSPMTMWLRWLPQNVIRSENVAAIQEDIFQAERDAFKETLTALNENTAEQKRLAILAAKKQRQYEIDNAAELAEMRGKHKQEMDDLKKAAGGSFKKFVDAFIVDPLDDFVEIVKKIPDELVELVKVAVSPSLGSSSPRF